MDVQFTKAEIDRLRETLQDYEPAQEAIATLEAEDGNIEASFEALWREKHGTPPQMGNKSFWEVTIQELRKEICGEDDSFRARVKEYSKNPGSAPLLTGLIVYLVGIAGLPLDPAIATVIVLYILKVGLNIFCEYTKPEP
jgi:hypothetical protein